jgi:hypothetical protein
MLEGTIDKIDEPHYFSYRWMPGMLDEKPSIEKSTLVEFTLTPQGEQTRLRVVETGFSRLPINENDRAEQFKDNAEGWASELRAGYAAGDCEAPDRARASRFGRNAQTRSRSAIRCSAGTPGVNRAVDARRCSRMGRST